MLHLDKSEALRYLGYAGQELDAELRQRFDTAVAECEAEAQPRCNSASFVIDWSRSSETKIALEGSSLVLEGRDIVRHLEGAREAVLMACTLGAQNERQLHVRTAINPTDALMYGAASSALVEAVADAESAAIADQAATRGLRAGSRFSPGYGDFPLEVQSAFLAAIDAPRRMGLTATETHLLVPTKSITAVVGLFDNGAEETSDLRSCETCSLDQHCTYKSQGRTCHG